MQEAYQEQVIPWEEKYDYIWALDTDIDITKTPLMKLFTMVERSQALITGPTFFGPGTDMVMPPGSLPASFLQAQLTSSIWGFQRPDPNCDYRITDFVELSAPILAKKSFHMILKECEACIHEKSDWGLDMMWCNFLSARSTAPGCALVDAAPVEHLDWKQTQPGWSFFAADFAVRRKYGQLWTHMQTLRCALRS